MIAIDGCVMIKLIATLIAMSWCFVAATVPPVWAQTVAANDRKCFSSWSEAAPIVRREGLATIENVNRLARNHAVTEIVNSTLCEHQGRYIYRLVVREAKGPLKTLVVDAREPFVR